MVATLTLLACLGMVVLGLVIQATSPGDSRLDFPPVKNKETMIQIRHDLPETMIQDQQL